MGACPYCRSATLPGDTICYSCGRVLPKGDRGSYRLEQQFSKRKGAKETTYMMAASPLSAVLFRRTRVGSATS